jgi:hypothetical protein
MLSRGNKRKSNRPQPLHKRRRPEPEPAIDAKTALAEIKSKFRPDDNPNFRAPVPDVKSIVWYHGVCILNHPNHPSTFYWFEIDKEIKRVFRDDTCIIPELAEIVCMYTSVKFQIDKGVDKGCSVFAAHDIEPGTIVCPMLGPIYPGVCSGEYNVGHFGTSESKTPGKLLDEEHYTIDGTPSSDRTLSGYQLGSYINEPSVGKTENCSLVMGRIPGSAFEPLFIVVTRPIAQGEELTWIYGQEYKRNYPIGSALNVLVEPVLLSFRQSMEVLRLYGLFNPGLTERYFAYYRYTDESSAVAAPVKVSIAATASATASGASLVLLEE